MDNQDPHHLLEQFLQSNGLKTTKQRRLIFDTLMSQNSHVSIEELFRIVQLENAKVGVATVYRTMNLLVQAGLALEHHFEDGLSRFEYALGVEHHDHLICNTCGHIFEFENEEIEDLQHKIAEAYGLTITSHMLNIYGNCKSPQNCSHRQNQGL